MSAADRGDPSPWIVRFSGLIGPGASVLDVACGRGRHAVHFADRGARVLGIDRDATALACVASVPNIDIRVADLENAPWPLHDRRFDAVVVARYLHRPLWPMLMDAVAPDGVLIYETFSRGNERHGRPRNPDFLLSSGELLEVVRGRMRVIAFEEGQTVGESPCVLQRIAAVGFAREQPIAFIE